MQLLNVVNGTTVWVDALKISPNRTISKTESAYMSPIFGTTAIIKQSDSTATGGHGSKYQGQTITIV